MENTGNYFLNSQEQINIEDRNFLETADAMPDAFIVLEPLKDENGRIADFLILYANPAAESFAGMQENGLEGERISRVNARLLTPLFIEQCRKAINTAIPVKAALPFIMPGKKRRVKKAECIITRFNSGAAVCWQTEIKVKSRKKKPDLTGPLFEKIFSSDTTAYLISRPSDGKILKANSSSERLLGYSENELTGKTISEFGLLPGIKKGDILHGDMADNGILQEKRVGIITASGSIKQAEMTAEIMKLEGEEFIVISLRDITERRRTEEQLKASIERFRITLDNMIEGCAILDFNWNYIYVNKANALHARLTPEEMIGRSMFELIPGVENSPFFEAYKSCMEKRISRQVEASFEFPDGSKAWYSAIANPVPEGIFVMSVDITSRKLTEEELKKKEKILSLILDHINEGIIVSSAPDGKVLAISRWGINHTIGRSIDAVIDLPVEKYLEQWDVRDIITRGKTTHDKLPVSRALNGETIQGEEWLMLRPDGSGFITSVNAVPIYDPESGRIVNTVATWSDITEKKNAEEALRQSEEKFFQAFQASPVPFSIARLPEGNWIDVNDSFVNLTGYSRDELIGHNSRELNIIVEDEPEQRQNIIESIRDHGRVINSEISARRKDGRLLNLLFSSVIVTLNGESFVISQHIDITQRKEAERELQNAKERYELLFNSIDEGFAHYKAIYDENGRINDLLVLEINPSGAMQSGVKREDQIGKTWRQVWTGLDDFIFDIYRDVDSNGRPFYFEHFNSITNRWYSTSITRIAPGQFAATFFDITERKLMEESIRNSEERYHKLADSMPQIVWTLNEEGEITYYNKKWYEYTGIEQPDIENYRKWFLVHPDDIPEVEKLWNKTFSEGLPFEMALRKRAADGSYYWHYDRIIPLKDNEGKINSWIATSTNIHDLKLSQQKLERTLRELERSNRDLERFAFAASHDLQEPVRMIGSYAHLLKKNYQGKLGTGADQYIKFLFEGALRLQVLIRDLMHYSRLSSQQQFSTRTDMNLIVSLALRELKREITQSGAAIKYPLLPEINANPDQMRELIKNLISNSVKFRSESEPPVVEISFEERKDEWFFRVSDNGIGIDPKYNNLIFTVFQRLNDREKYPGVGVGLAICKRIVERHEGRIWVESEKAHGADFCFTIPKVME